MKHFLFIFAALLLLELRAAETNALALVKTISLPHVRGRIDHFAVDAQGQRLFMAALGNDTVEVLDMADGKRLRSLAGCSTPQGLAYVPNADRLFVANGRNGTVQMLDGVKFKVLKTTSELSDADNLRYDAKAGLIYAGYGNGALAVISATNGALFATIKLAGHPESFELERNGARIFVNVPDARKIEVVDRKKRAVIATWPMEKFHSNFPMALDEGNHRLLIGCRHPARLVVFDTNSGNEVGEVEISGDADDAFYDACRKRIYVSCGAGFIDVIDQRDADSYTIRERVPTVSGARTSLYSPERDEFFLAVRAGLFSGSAEVRAYKVR